MGVPGGSFDEVMLGVCDVLGVLDGDEPGEGVGDGVGVGATHAVKTTLPLVPLVPATADCAMSVVALYAAPTMVGST